MWELIGFLLPPLIDMVNRKIGDSDARFWVSVLLCGIVGVGVNYLDNGMMFGPIDEIAKSIMAVFGISQLVYHGGWKNSNVRDKMNLTPEE